MNDRLALIVTRLDADETLDPEGRYRITLTSTVESADDGGQTEKTLAGEGSVAQ